MKALFFLLLSTLGFLSVDSYGCRNENMNQLCLSKVVENCYTCEHLVPIKDVLNPVCVPLFHHNLGVLENYPADKWNCTIYRPELNTDVKNEITELETENDMIENFCKLDNFVSDICGDEDKNGFCMIANYINDICENDEDDEDDDDEDDDEQIFRLNALSLKTKGILFPACTGPICSKEGWQYIGGHFGKTWCGMGSCKEHGTRVFCTYPTNCGKRTTQFEEHDFQTLGGK